MQRLESHLFPPTGRALLRGLALVAMLFQILLTTDHLGASAVRAFGAEPEIAGFGLMEICAGDGVLVIELGGGAEKTGDACPVCISAAVADFGEVAAAAPPDPAFALLAQSSAISVGEAVTSPGVSSTKPIRAPPSRLS
ncbi:hypothetical protein R3X27_21245 [Tropicimonas sp. TH_r6]|uniref:hypothetical protein n=1 Tax=Tropicimonas sp. TH_r6 TaxID=3082085 RepID=UPI002954348C|nr:hypothetical protein [Tropicimonas sp. TH_r6]MDV7145217.1 hypothetical protein [Tropicimonas sp. TH_r6]